MGCGSSKDSFPTIKVNSRFSSSIETNLNVRSHQQRQQLQEEEGKVIILEETSSPGVPDPEQNLKKNLCQNLQQSMVC